MTGRKKAPYYRVVVANLRSKRASKPLEILGHWDKSKNLLKINKEKLNSWLKKGAEISEGVAKILK